MRIHEPEERPPGKATAGWVLLELVVRQPLSQEPLVQLVRRLPVLEGPGGLFCQTDLHSQSFYEPCTLVFSSD